MTYSGAFDLWPLDSRLFYRLFAHSGNISAELIKLSIVFRHWVISLDGTNGRTDGRTDGVQCAM